jgi:hypothetical protein
MIFAALQNQHGKFGEMAPTAACSACYERGPHYIAKRITYPTIRMPATLPF